VPGPTRAALTLRAASHARRGPPPVFHSWRSRAYTGLLLNKVPEVTIYFWLIKVLSTTVGETAADFLRYLAISKTDVDATPA